MSLDTGKHHHQKNGYFPYLSGISYVSTSLFFSGGKNTYGPPRWLGGKESSATAGDAGLIPGSGRFYGGENATHSSILAWKKPVDRGAW